MNNTESKIFININEQFKTLHAKNNINERVKFEIYTVGINSFEFMYICDLCAEFLILASLIFFMQIHSPYLKSTISEKVSIVSVGLE